MTVGDGVAWEYVGIFAAVVILPLLLLDLVDTPSLAIVEKSDPLPEHTKK